MAERAESNCSILRAARDEIHSELAELEQALSAVVQWSNVLAHSLATARRMATTMPGGISYIGRDGTVMEGVRIRDSDLDGEWGAEWQRHYGQWCRSIRDAIDAVGRPSVAALMDPNSHPHPALCWTSRVRDALNRLQTSLHPMNEGADGMGFLRAGANSLPASFTFPLDRIRGAVAELRAVAPTFTPVAKAALSATPPPLPARIEVVLWPGAEHNDRNVRLARTRTAYLEAHGDVAVALTALKAGGNEIARSTFYNHLNALDRESPGWRASIQLSNPTGNMDGMRKAGTRWKSRGKVR